MAPVLSRHHSCLDMYPRPKVPLFLEPAPNYTTTPRSCVSYFRKYQNNVVYTRAKSLGVFSKYFRNFLCFCVLFNSILYIHFSANLVFFFWYLLIYKNKNKSQTPVCDEHLTHIHLFFRQILLSLKRLVCVVVFCISLS